MAISIHALREEGDQNGGECCGRVVISIHALREEGDYAIAAPKGQVQNFYPRPPRGGRQTASAGAEEAVLFLSTPSARRATDLSNDLVSVMIISIHALREEGDQQRHRSSSGPGFISIHALREEGDYAKGTKAQLIGLFLSTPSARRATKDGAITGFDDFISIHALREEGDHRQLATGQPLHIFLSTPSARRAT